MPRKCATLDPAYSHEDEEAPGRPRSHDGTADPGHASPSGDQRSAHSAKADNDLRCSMESPKNSPRLKQTIDRLKLTEKIRLSSCFKTLRDMKGEIAIDEKSVEDVKLLGKGAFGSVHLSNFVTEGKSTKVAVKRLNKDLVAPTAVAQFKQECELMKKLSHRNTVDFIGMGITKSDGSGALFLVQEFCDSGSLHGKLMCQMERGSVKLKEYTVLQVLDWLSDIARGLSYLHGASPMVVHRDLKLENVLLHKSGDREEVKLADFGLSATLKMEVRARRRSTLTLPTIPDGIFAESEEKEPVLSPEALKRLDSSRSTQSEEGKDSTLHGLKRQGSAGRVRGTAHASASIMRRMGSVLTGHHIGASKMFNLTGNTGSLMYMAPEVYKNSAYNEKVDIFALGVIAYELFQGYSMLCMVSHSGMPYEIENHACRTSQGERKSIPAKWPSGVRELISSLWAQSPDMRPTASEVLQQLDSLKPEIQDWHAQLSTSTCCPW